MMTGMRAIVCEELGQVSVREVDPPRTAGQVIIDVAAAGVNYVDGLFVRGRYQIKPPLPFVPGGEVAGVVSATCDGGPPVGTRVLAMCGLGGFAEQVTVPATSAVPIPDVLDFPRAATFTQSYATGLYALARRGGLTAGEKVLVLGAGGGVGLAAVQVAKSLGASVLAGASAADKRDAALKAGADEVVDTSSADLKTVARGWSDGGVDLVYDPVGGDLAEPALRSLREFGRYLVIGFASGAIPAIPLNQVLLRNRAVIGVDWAAWLMANPADHRALLNDLLTMVADHRLDPTPPKTYPLDQAEQALHDLLNRRVVGKLALIP